MKPTIFFGALLFSATPAFANDFVYMKCEANAVMLTKDLRSNQIVKREEDTDLMHFKIDSANSRIMESREGAWEDVKIVHGSVVVEKEKTADGVSSYWKVTMPVDPPGQIVMDALSRSDELSQSAKASGMCKEIDESVFEELLDQ